MILTAQLIEEKSISKACWAAVVLGVSACFKYQTLFFSLVPVLFLTQTSHGALSRRERVSFIIPFVTITPLLFAGLHVLLWVAYPPPNHPTIMAMATGWFNAVNGGSLKNSISRFLQIENFAQAFGWGASFLLVWGWIKTLKRGDLTSQLNLLWATLSFAMIMVYQPSDRYLIHSFVPFVVLVVFGLKTFMVPVWGPLGRGILTLLVLIQMGMGSLDAFVMLNSRPYTNPSFVRLGDDLAPVLQDQTRIFIRGVSSSWANFVTKRRVINVTDLKTTRVGSFEWPVELLPLLRNGDVFIVSAHRSDIDIMTGVVSLQDYYPAGGNRKEAGAFVNAQGGLIRFRTTADLEFSIRSRAGRSCSLAVFRDGSVFLAGQGVKNIIVANRFIGDIMLIRKISLQARYYPLM